ncbi:MAG TPA: response regulator [Chthoniobacter sp.]|jgi:signal transduction histidine kinase/DNA-binding response OmpR family regulator
MKPANTPHTADAPMTARATELFEQNLQHFWRRTDRMFIWLMLFEWLLGIGLAFWLSPRTWAGAASAIHPHVWAAIFFGGAITSLPVMLAWHRPGRASTRQVVAAGQMLMSALLIHVMNGRIEAHFQIFGSLAFLAFYRDWKVLATATVVVAADHFLRGVYFPQSIFGVAVADSWRWLEHAAYVVFEDVFLLLAVHNSLKDSASDARRKAALEALKEGVEDEVATRTMELTAEIAERRRVEQELAAARDAALQAARSKAQFLANMSHEIRTPMNGVMGMAGLLLDTQLDRDQHEYVSTIRESGDLLLTIINDILDFSKIEAGKMHFEVLDFDMREVVESTLEMLAEKAQAKGLELLGDVPPHLCTLRRGDAGRLRQILTNLINNAIKFTETGEVVVKVAQQNEMLLRFEVHDTGIGIAPEVQNHLFQPFIQADGTTTRKYGGTGLGLAIARQLVELMDGEIGVISEVGKGSNFWFTACLGQQDIQRQARNRDDLAGLRILIVDDNATNRHILEIQLASLRMHCTAVESGAEALAALSREQARGNPFDLAIIDMQMPEMDGVMLARAVKSEPAIAATRLIMLSSLGRHVDTSSFKAVGIEEYLVKPVKQSRLFDCLAEVMGRSEKDDGPHEVVARPLPLASAAGHHERVLLAEDNMINQKIALRQLAKLGYQADAVADGLEVLEALERIPYNIILMDCQMPDLDGYEATRRIRRKQTRPIYIIAMTANAMQGDREKCLAAGMDAYLTKPVRPEELAAALALCHPAASMDSPVDFKQLSDAADGDPAEMHALATIYLEQADELMPELAAALAEASAPDVNAVAHKFAGASASCGMIALVPLLRELEQMGRSGNLSGASECHERVIAAFARTRDSLTKYLSSAGESAAA